MFRKVTAGNTLWDPSNHHTKILIKGIPTGQFLWICRNCSCDDDFRWINYTNDLGKEANQTGDLSAQGGKPLQDHVRNG